jgi:hypothetical protein
MGTALVRRTVMREVYGIAILVVLFLACTPTQPEPKEAVPAEAKAAPAVEPAEAAPPAKAEPEESEAPKQPEQPIDTAPSPTFEMIERKPEGELDFGCPFEIVSRGFPAASEDGTALVDTQGVFESPCTELTWYEADKDRVTVICNEALESNPDSDAPTCEDQLADARKRVTTLNAELATKTWRRLEHLNALFSRPGPAFAMDRFGINPWSPLDIDEVLASIPGADRPLEIYYAGGHFIARIKGVKVLQDTPLPQWQKQEPPPPEDDGDDDPCVSPPPQISALQLDRATNLALVYYNHNMAESCACDDYREYARRIELAPEVLVEAEKRSNDKFMAALKVAVAKVEAAEVTD